MEHILSIITAIIPSVISGIVLLVMKHQQRKAEKREADRDEREELTLAAIDAMFCITKELTDCVLYRKPPNGELEDAFDYKQDIKHKMEDYQRRRAARS